MMAGIKLPKIRQETAITSQSQVHFLGGAQRHFLLWVGSGQSAHWRE
jgi:hypothetical protein